MNDSGAILRQISSSKLMLDQVNEEIEASIHRTREIESEIVKCSDVEKSLLIREIELTKMISVKEFEMNGLIQVTAIASSSLEQIKKELNHLRMNREETLIETSDSREKFIVLCENFQRGIVKGETEEFCMLLLEKEGLEEENSNINKKIYALRNSTSSFIEEVLEELHKSNTVLKLEIQRGNSENVKLLKDIDDLKNSMLALSSLKDDSRKVPSHASHDNLPIPWEQKRLKYS